MTSLVRALGISLGALRRTIKREFFNCLGFKLPLRNMHTPVVRHFSELPFKMAVMDMAEVWLSVNRCWPTITQSQRQHILSKLLQHFSSTKQDESKVLYKKIKRHLRQPGSCKY